MVTQSRNIFFGDHVIANEWTILQSCDTASIEIGHHVVLSFGATILTGGIELNTRFEALNHECPMLSSRTMSGSVLVRP